jgi:hypothetical protein
MLIGHQVIARFEQPVAPSPYDYQLDGILETVDTCNQVIQIGDTLINMRHAVLLSVMQAGNPKAVGAAAIMEMKAYLKELMSPLVDADAVPEVAGNLLDMLHRAELAGGSDAKDDNAKALERAMQSPFFRAGWHAYDAAFNAGLHTLVVPQYRDKQWQAEWSRGYVWNRDGCDNYDELNKQTAATADTGVEAIHLTQDTEMPAAVTYTDVPTFHEVVVGDRVWAKNDTGGQVKGIGVVEQKFPGTCAVMFGEMMRWFSHTDYGTGWGATRQQQMAPAQEEMQQSEPAAQNTEGETK